MKTGKIRYFLVLLVAMGVAAVNAGAAVSGTSTGDPLIGNIDPAHQQWTRS